MGFFSVAEVVGFGRHFWRSTAGGVVWEIAGDGSVSIVVWVVGGAADAVTVGFVAAGVVGLGSMVEVVRPLALRTPSRRSSATSLMAMSSNARLCWGCCRACSCRRGSRRRGLFVAFSGCRGEGLLDFAEAVVGDALVAGLLFFPELRAAGSAAEGVFAIAGKFSDAVVAEDVEEIAGGVVDAVVAAEVAGIVIGDGRFAGGWSEFFVGDEGFEILGVMHDLVVAADLFVLMADGIHAVGAAGDDQFGLDGVEGGDILVGELAVEVFVAGTAGAVAGATFFFAEHSEVDFGVVEEFDEGARGFLRLRIVARGAAYPVEDVGGGIFVGGLDVEAVGPGHSLLVVDAPGILRALHAAECGLQLRGELAFDHDLVAADVDDVEHLLILRGADLHAGAAGGAGPGGFGGESELEQRVGAGSFFSKGAGVKAKGLRSAARSLSSMRLLISSAAGERDFPVAVAGQTSWQRLHWMQA